MIERRGGSVPHLVHERPDALQARRVVGLAEIHRAADARVHLRAPEFFGGNLLADRGFDQRRARREQATPLGHQDVVAHHRQIGASGHAHAHDGGDLPNAERAHHSVVAKDAAEVVGVRENVFLERQEYARRVHQINCGNAVLDGDILRANHLLGGQGEECAGFYRGVVGDDHEQAALDAPEARHHSRGRRAAPLGVHAMGCKERELEPRTPRVQEFLQALARRQPAFLMLRGDILRAAALADFFFFVLHRRHKFHHAAMVLLRLGRIQVESRLNLR